MTINFFKGISSIRYLYPKTFLSEFYLKMSSMNFGPIEQAIRDAITEQLEPVHYEVVNESYMHNVPKDSETHFKVLVVSSKFESLPLIRVS